MPGKKHMNQDRPVDGQDTLQTMQDKKSGIYQDRTDGKLPQSRVAQHYQDMDAKMAQDAVQNLKNVGEGVKYGAKSFASGVSDLGSAAYKAGKSAVSAITNSPVGKAVGATLDYLDGTKEKEAIEYQKNYNKKRKEIMNK